MNWDTANGPGTKPSTDSSSSWSRFHEDTSDVCARSSKSCIMLINCSHNQYTAQFVRKPAGYTDNTEAAKATWELPTPPAGAEVITVLIPANSTYFMVGEARNKWLHRPVWTGAKMSVRTGFNFKP